eukprot:3164846-Rhodomonas_salina.1
MAMNNVYANVERGKIQEVLCKGLLLLPMTDDETGEMLDALCCFYKSLEEDWSRARLYRQCS